MVARDPVLIAAQRASEWLPGVLGAGHQDELTVVWHSVMRQYVEPEEWAAIERALHEHPAAVRLSMEPSLDDHLGLQQLTFRGHPDESEIVLALVGDHGLPIRWETYSLPA